MNNIAELSARADEEATLAAKVFWLMELLLPLVSSPDLWSPAVQTEIRIMTTLAGPAATELAFMFLQRREEELAFNAMMTDFLRTIDRRNPYCCCCLLLPQFKAVLK